MQGTEGRAIVRFGEFEVDLAAGELRRSGRKVRLQDQPFRLLCFLLHRPGEVVGREELQAHLWPAGTVVEFEHSINTALKKIRQALGDSAADPQFVETIPRRGYRYKAALKQIPEGIRSLAVLPMENLSGNPAQEHFCDGMTEALISHLGSISVLRVISRTSIMRYKGARRALPEIARELSVDAVIEGSAFPVGGRVRITVQLLDARADRHLWSGSYERDLRDVLDLQREVAQAVAQEIRVALTVRQRSRLTRPLSIAPDAQEAYLKGRYHFNRRWEMKQAIQCFQQAIELDPSYALAYAGVAECYRKLGENHIFPPAEALPRAKAAAIQAVELDEEIPEAHVALGAALTNLDWDWHAAEREFHRALELNPSHAEAHEEFAWYLSVMGRSQEAVVEADRALQLDPFSPLRHAHLGMALYFARRYDQAIEELRRSIDSLPESPHSAPIRSNFLAFAYAQTGRHEESIANLSKLRSAGNNSPDLLFSLGYAYAWSGKRIMAEEMIREIESVQESYALPFSLAMVYAGLGDWDRVLDCLESAFKERVWVTVLVNSEPSFEPLRGHPRFQAILRQMNLKNRLSAPSKDDQAVVTL